MSEPIPPAPPISKWNLLKDGYYSFRANPPKYLPADYPDLTSKTALITGTNTGIGFEVMKLLYSKNCNIIAVVRSAEKGEAAKKEAIEKYPNSKGSISVVGGNDFLDLTTVKPASEEIKLVLGDKPLNIIIHNAGLMAPVNTGTSKQGLEAMFSTNVLGPQLLQHFLDPLFLKKDDDLKRIVWVSSGAHANACFDYGIHWDDPVSYTHLDVYKRQAFELLFPKSFLLPNYLLQI